MPKQYIVYSIGMDVISTHDSLDTAKDHVRDMFSFEGGSIEFEQEAKMSPDENNVWIAIDPEGEDTNEFCYICEAIT